MTEKSVGGVEVKKVRREKKGRNPREQASWTRRKEREPGGGVGDGSGERKTKKKKTKINFSAYLQTPINASNCMTKTFVKQYAVRRNIGFVPCLFLSAFDTAAKINKSSVATNLKISFHILEKNPTELVWCLCICVSLYLNAVLHEIHAAIG